MADVFDALTHCGRSSPMGRLLREYWVPAVPTSAVDADGAPYAIQLLGECLVVFRDTEGRVGVIDEACPHRGASMAIGRNEDCGLRCLYHGWKLDVEGNVVDTPREQNRNYGRRVPPSGYPTVERAGIIWTYLGEQRPAPPLPSYPFSMVPDEHVGTLCIEVRCNWLLGLEAAWDPTHVPVLHQSSLNPDAPVTATTLGIAPYDVFDVDRRPYGARMAQVAPVGDDLSSVRMKEYVFPFLRMNSQTVEEDSDLVVFGQVPMDDERMMFWFIHYNHEHAPARTGYPIQSRGPTGIRSMPYGREQRWGQDRSAMDRHFTGLSLDDPAIGLIVEDLVVLESMVPMLDRSRHHLTPGDGMLTKCRHLLKVFLEEYERDGTRPDHAEVADLKPRFLVISRDRSWREFYPEAVAAAPAG